MDAAHAKAQETARKNRELRKAARQAEWEMEKTDRAIMLDALRDVIKDKTASPGERLFSVSVLDYAKSYHLIPMRLMEKVDLSALVKEVEAIQASQKAKPNNSLQEDITL